MSIHNQKKSSTEITFPVTIDKLEQTIKENIDQNPDLIFSTYEHQGTNLAIFYNPFLLDTEKLESMILDTLLDGSRAWTNKDILNEIPLTEGETTKSLQDIQKKLPFGGVFIYVEEEKSIISYTLFKEEKRGLEKAETESIVLGPQMAFSESLSTNLNVVRQRIQTSDLIFEKITVGQRVPSEVRMIYLKSLANDTDIDTMRQRLLDVDVDEIEDATVLKQYIEDSSTNLFPQYYTTELPDRLCYTLKRGKIGILVENSPISIIAPSSFFSFFESTEDVYMRWYTGSVLRFLRFFAFFIAIIITPIYVAVITYQYELIPTKLLITIGMSRSKVPFPPIFEALLIELMIELLREAGARLPTKVGQTMGIVGGLVIGEASVQAGITSNVLIIVVAVSALASFTTPSYLMGTSVRFIRFPMIALAAIYGLIGIMFGLCFLIIHLLRLTSLGRPSLAPLYPLKLSDFNDVFYHLPFQYQYNRAKMSQTKDSVRYPKKDAKQKRDIDE